METLNRIYFFLSLILIVGGCRKDNFKSKYHEIEGVWNWEYTITIKRDMSGNAIITDTISPSEAGFYYEIEFTKNGRISFYENDSRNEYWKRNCIDYWKDYGQKVEFSINQNCNESKENINLYYFRPDTLVVIGGRPFESYNENYFAYSRYNYFIRE